MRQKSKTIQNTVLNRKVSVSCFFFLLFYHVKKGFVSLTASLHIHTARHPYNKVFSKPAWQMATRALHLNFTILTVGMFLYNLEALGLEKTHTARPLYFPEFQDWHHILQSIWGPNSALLISQMIAVPSRWASFDVSGTSSAKNINGWAQ